MIASSFGLKFGSRKPNLGTREIEDKTTVTCLIIPPMCLCDPFLALRFGMSSIEVVVGLHLVVGQRSCVNRINILSCKMYSCLLFSLQ